MGSSFESVAVDIADHVAQVTLIGPGKGNAMGPAFWAELPVVFAELDADPDVRAIVLTGSGRNFSYGLDLAAMGNTLSAMLAEGALAKPRADFHTRLKSMQQSITAVADCRTPTIASVHGWCIGGGVDLVSAVDIRYASSDAKFSVREVKLAIVADVGSLARLPLILSDGHLRELALTGKDIDAARAEKIGLVNDVYSDAEASLARRAPLPSRLPPTRRWWCRASRTCSTSSGPPTCRPACAMSRRGIRRSCRPRTSPRGSPPCSRSGHRTSPGSRPALAIRGGRRG